MVGNARDAAAPAVRLRNLRRFIEIKKPRGNGGGVTSPVWGRTSYTPPGIPCLSGAVALSDAIDFTGPGFLMGVECDGYHGNRAKEEMVKLQ